MLERWDAQEVDDDRRTRSWPSAGKHAWAPARAAVEQSLPKAAPESREGWGDRNRIAIEGRHPLSPSVRS